MYFFFNSVRERKLILDDVSVSSSVAYSLRKLKNNYAGSAIKVRRSSDNAELDIGFVNGELDTQAITNFLESNVITSPLGVDVNTNGVSDNWGSYAGATTTTFQVANSEQIISIENASNKNGSVVETPYISMTAGVGLKLSITFRKTGDVKGGIYVNCFNSSNGYLSTIAYTESTSETDTILIETGTTPVDTAKIQVGMGINALQIGNSGSVYFSNVVLSQTNVSAYVRTWYDQSGNDKNAIQTEVEFQPRIVNEGTIETGLNFLQASNCAMTITGFTSLPNNDDFTTYIKAKAVTGEGHILYFGDKWFNKNMFLIGYDQDNTRFVFDFNTEGGMVKSKPSGDIIIKSGLNKNLANNKYIEVNNNINETTTEETMDNITSSYIGRASWGNDENFGGILTDIIIFNSSLSERDDELVKNNLELVENPPLLLDIVSDSVLAYGLKKFRTAYTGNCIQVRRSSDNSLLDIGFDSNGNLDTTALSSFVGEGSGFVRTIYDQSGNGTNAVQTAANNQALIVDAGTYLETMYFWPSANPSFYTIGEIAKIIKETDYTIYNTYPAIYDTSARGMNVYLNNATQVCILRTSGTNFEFRTQDTTSRTFSYETLTKVKAGLNSGQRVLELNGSSVTAGSSVPQMSQLTEGYVGRPSYGALSENGKFKLDNLIIFNKYLSSGDDTIVKNKLGW